jgi:hypothetical protein
MSRVIKDMIRRLNTLIRLDQAAAMAYTAAITEGTNADDGQALKARVADHRRHVDELVRLVRNLGGDPMGWGDFTPARPGPTPNVQGGVQDCAAFLEPLQHFEQAVLEAYEKAASQPGVPHDISLPIRQHLTEEREHMAWIRRRLSEKLPR